MDTDALIIDDDNLIRDNPPNLKVGDIVKRVHNMLKNNPEIPDALRDMAPYFSNDMRQKIIKIAACGDFLIRLDDSRDVNTLEAREPINGFYSTMKKYIPMNKRQSIDGIMSVIQNVKIKMQPKPAANNIENMINTLTKLNEMNKIMSGASTIKKLTDTIGSTNVNKGTQNMDGLMSLINNFVGDDKMNQISGMLGKLTNR